MRRQFAFEPLDSRVLFATVTFQEGVNGYLGTLDTFIRQDNAAGAFGGATTVMVDGDDNGATGAQPVQGLIQFANMFGSGAGQIPAGSTITSATLTLRTGTASGDSSSNSMALHRMLVNFSEASTWNSLAGGINLGTDAATAATASATPSTVNGNVTFNVTSAVQAWAANTASSFGFAVTPSGTNGWIFDSSESATASRRPVFTVTFTPPGGQTNQAPIVNAGADQTIPMPGTDLDGTVSDDGLPTPPGAVTTLWEKVSGPGDVTFGNANLLDTSVSFSQAGTYVLRLSANDGNLSSADEITVSAEATGTPLSRTFREGVGGYIGTQDVHIRQIAPTSSPGAAVLALVDGDEAADAGNQVVQSLIRFDNIFGNSAGQIPSGVTITSATLTFVTSGRSTNTMSLHRMLVNWSEASSWSSLANGVSLGSEASTSTDASFIPSVAGASNVVNVTNSLQAWASNPSLNLGWLITSDGTDGWDWHTSEATTSAMRPVLSVTYSTEAPVNTAPDVSAGADQNVTLPSNANLNGTVTDDGLPNGNVTTLWSKISGPGTVTFGNSNAVDTTAGFSSAGTYVLRLTASDGDLSAFDEVTVVVSAQSSAPQFPNPVQVSTDTQHKPQSKVWEHSNNFYTVLPRSDGTWVWRLDGQNWTPIIQLSTLNNTRADTLVAGNVTHILLQTGGGARLASIEFVNGSYQMWSQRPTVVDVPIGSGMETVTFARDGAGRLWVAYDTGTVIQVRFSDGNYSSFSAGITIGTGVTTDDICAITTLSNGSVAVMWANQNTKRFGFRTHAAGADPNTWTADENPGGSTALNVGHGFADDHMHMVAGSNGVLYVAMKTGYDADSGSTSGGLPLVGLMVRRANGQWDNIYTVDTTGTRPIVMVNESQNKVIVAYRIGGTGIVYRESAISSLGFGSRKTLIGVGDLNNVSSTRQVVTDDAVFIATTESNVMHSVRLFWNSSNLLFSSDRLIASDTKDEDVLIASKSAAALLDMSS